MPTPQKKLFETPQTNTPSVRVSKTIISTRQAEDWVHRLTEAAAEAWDENLPELESDLLDVRDEIYSHLP